MNLIELQELWEQRKAALQSQLSKWGEGEAEYLNLEAKISELTECLHELGQLYTVGFMNDEVDRVHKLLEKYRSKFGEI